MRVNLDWLRDWVELEATPSAWPPTSRPRGSRSMRSSRSRAATEASSSREVLARRAASERRPLVGLPRRRRRGPASSRLRRAERRRGHQSAVRARRREAAGRQGDRRRRAARRAVERHAVLGEGARARRRRRRPVDPRRRRAEGRERSAEYLRLDDAVLEINVTPNRGDCFSVIGIARELAARRNTELRAAAMPRRRRARSTTTFPISLERRRRAARGSPAASCAGFRAAPARRCGCASGCGAPAFGRCNRSSTSRTTSCSSSASRCTPTISRSSTAASRRGSRAPARSSRCSTAASVALAADMLVIADARGPVGLAGVMGGQDDGRQRQRRTPCSSRARSSRPAAIVGPRRAGSGCTPTPRCASSAASIPTGQARAIERATELLLAICGGQAGPVSRRRAPRRPAASGRAVTLRRERLRARARRRGAGEAGRGDFRAARDEGGADGGRVARDAAGVPLRHRDRGRPDRGSRPHVRLRRDSGDAGRSRRAARASRASRRSSRTSVADLLAARGYAEAITYSFIDPALDALVNPGASAVELANPIASDMAVLRPLAVAGAHQRGAPQREPSAPARCGCSRSARSSRRRSRASRRPPSSPGWRSARAQPEHWDGAGPDVDYFDVKGDVEAVLRLTGAGGEFRFEAATHPALSPGRTARILRGDRPVGWLGALHPELAKRIDKKRTAVVFALQLEALAPARRAGVRAVLEVSVDSPRSRDRRRRRRQRRGFDESRARGGRRHPAARARVRRIPRQRGRFKAKKHGFRLDFAGRITHAY